MGMRSTAERGDGSRTLRVDDERRERRGGGVEEATKKKTQTLLAHVLLGVGI
jgi:hypothetical protein